MKEDMFLRKLERQLVDNPNDPQAHYELGMYFAKKSNFRTAINELEKSVLINPKNLEVQYNLGILYSRTSQYEQAIRCWRVMTDRDGDIVFDYIKKTPEARRNAAEKMWDQFRERPNPSAYIFFTLGFAYLMLGKWKQALENFHISLEMNPQLESASFYKGISNYKLGQYNQAASDFLVELTHRPQYVQCLYNLGVTYLEMGNFPQASRQFKRVLEESPNHMKAYFQVAKALAEQGSFDRAINALEKVMSLDPKFIHAYYEMGVIYEKKFMMDQAVEMYKKTLEMDPYFKGACLTLGTLYKKLGKPELAVEYMKKTIELDPNEGDALYQMGLIHLQQENYKESINSFQKVVMIMPENPTAHYSLGLSYYNLGKINEAIHEYEIAVSLNPRDAQVRNALGISYILNEDYEKGKECFNAVLDVNTRDPIAYYNLANISFREKDFNNASKLYEKVTEFDTSADYSDFTLAARLLREGADDRAVQVLADTVKKTPGSEKEMVIHSYIQILAVAAIEQANKKMTYQAPFGIMESSVTEMVGILADITDARIPGKEGHSRRVSELASIVAPDLGFSAEETSYIQFAGLIHDVGKLFIPESVLEKEKEELTEEEMEVIQSHPEMGYEILENVTVLEESSAYALFHHERYDGSGYPEGIAGDEIPLGAQILGISDYWDNLISSQKLTPAAAIDKIIEQRNLMFSSKVLDTFLAHVDHFLLLY